MKIDNIQQLLEHIETDKKAEELVDYINNLQIKNKQLEDLLHKANDEVISYTNCCIDLKEKIDQIKDIYTSMQFSAPENYYLWIDKLGEILGGKE